MTNESGTDVAQAETSANQIPRLFSVISWGCAATAWLAKAINSHPEIFCLHAGNRYWSQSSGSQILQGVDYLQAIASQANGYTAAGDVHGVSSTDVAALQAQFAEQFRHAVVVREPLPRFSSLLAIYRDNPGSRVWGDMRYLTPILAEHGLDIEQFTYEELLRFHAANMLNAILEEQTIGAVFRSEDLTSDPLAFANFVQHLIGDAIPRDEEWAARVVSKPTINRHRVGGRSMLTELERHALSICVRPETWAAYEALGYDISEGP